MDIEKIQLIAMIAIPLYSLIVIFVGLYLGHKLTMKAFAHVQPSTKDMVKLQEGRTSTEPDYFEEAMEEPAPKVSPEKDSKVKNLFKKMGIPGVIWDSYKKNGKHPEEFLGPNPDDDGSEIDDVEQKIREADF